MDVAIQPPAVMELRQMPPRKPFIRSLLPIRQHEAKRVLAFMLPGGGAHGCFGAAVLATLLTHPDLYNVEIAASVGASAGAINGGIATSALQQVKLTETQRRRLAAERLDAFWQENVIDNFWLSGMLNAFQATSAFCEQTFNRNKPDWVPECSLNGQYATRFLEPKLRKFIPEPLSKPKKHLPQMFVGTSRMTGRHSFEPAVHGNDVIDPSVLLASGGLVDIFGARKLYDGSWHADGAYTANPNEAPLQDMKKVTDVIWIMNDPADRPISKSSKLKSAWEQIAPYRQTASGQRHHEIHLDRRLPEYTRIIPTVSQNETLWKDGVKAAHEFMRSQWPQPAYAAA